ncbi:MAG TPA: hypothetical protein VGF67_11935 [Ktedonobacteraceae bacterium]|jgi:hypothetical protein
MLRLSLQGPARERRRSLAVIALVVVETALVTMALIPAQEWTHLLPNAPGAALDGPFPPTVALIIPALLYLVPTLVGFLCRHWQQALLYATLPAWIGLGLFVIAASFKVGIFYLVSADSVTANVSVLELFAALGAIGWLARYLVLSHTPASR